MRRGQRVVVVSVSGLWMGPSGSVSVLFVFFSSGAPFLGRLGLGEPEANHRFVAARLLEGPRLRVALEGKAQGQSPFLETHLGRTCGDTLIFTS